LKKTEFNKSRIVGLSSLILSYLCLTLSFVFDNEKGDYVYLFYIAWIFGIVSVISNIIFAEKINVKSWLIFLLGICGVLWFFPPFLITYFGIPCMITFLAIGIYIHIQSFKTKKGKTA